MQMGARSIDATVVLKTAGDDHLGAAHREVPLGREVQDVKGVPRGGGAVGTACQLPGGRYAIVCACFCAESCEAYERMPFSTATMSRSGAGIWQVD